MSSRKPLKWLFALALVIFAAWTFHPSEPVRPFLYLALLGEPFALLTALVIDPPSDELIRFLKGTAFLLVAVQVPISLWQVHSLGTGDPVQGTLYGAGAGADTMSAVVVLAAVWILGSDLNWVIRAAMALSLLAIPLFADAKQVIFAVPIAALLSGRRWSRGNLFKITAATGALVILLLFVPAGQTALRFLQDAQSGRGGKEAVVELVGRKLDDSPITIFLGMGPAETVSRAAFMTTDLLLRSNSPIHLLDLHPADIAIEAESEALARSGGGTSFNSGVSSAIGVVGDLGLVGAAIYGGLLLTIIGSLRKNTSTESQAALFGWFLFAILGLVFDWWEQPPLSIFLAIVTALALTTREAPEVERPAMTLEELTTRSRR